jgi:SAM-dependent methyltransferase
MEKDNAAFTGSIPASYDADLGPVIFADYGADIAERVAATGARNVLEIAAGTGIVTRQLRNLLPPDAQVTATDLNPPVLDIARVKFRAGERVAFQPADAGALPFNDGAFDALVCQFGVMFFPDKDLAYREARRVLKPGGRYFFSVWDAVQHNPFIRHAHEIVAGAFTVDPPTFYQVPVGYFALDPIKTALETAGFSDIEISVAGRIKEVASIAGFARGLIHGNPTIDLIRARGGIDPDALAGRLAKALEHEFGANPCRLPMQAIIFEARRR